VDIKDALIVRRAVSADQSELVEILYDTFESTWRPSIEPAAAQAYREQCRPERYVAKRGLEFRVAVYDGALVGFVDWDRDFVNALHVRSGYARTGLGRALMNTAEAEISNAGFTAVRLETDTFNLASQAFYRGRGYEEAGRYPDLEWNSGLTTILFIKSLV
jgi:ribosomal protein S18 acetylase RimI-like enzyme